VADAGLTHGDWLQRVPQLLNDCAEEWTLRLGEPYPQGTAGYVVHADPDTALDVAFQLLEDEVVRDYVLGHSCGEVVRRLDRLVAELGLDRERAHGGTIGQTVAWMFESTQLQQHLETVRWLVGARA
jgi:hypothetical protein